MTDHHEPRLDAVDQAGRAAGRGLHDHVQRHVDPELVLAGLPAADVPTRRGRLLAAAAVAALFFGSVAVLGDGPEGDERSRLEVDEDGNPLPVPQPAELTFLGPSDGRDSEQLPLTVEPSTDLRDGDEVTVSGTGFVPGEQVGIVQCAREAGGEVREQRAGIDGCTITGVAYADADSDGRATGTYRVHRIITTAVTGTVDCAAEADRCIIAMGALSDYDRSGGLAVSFRGGGEPLDLPTLTVSPAEALGDADVVLVEGSGFPPGALLGLSVCSLDPSACWSTGEEIEITGEQAAALGYEGVHLGLQSDDEGRVSGHVPVWRYLPGPTPGTYVDCAVSRCALRVNSASNEVTAMPAPVPLTFVGGGEGPIPPAIEVHPTDDLRPGDEVVVRGAGFEPRAYLEVSLCATPADDPQRLAMGCVSSDGGEPRRVDDDGGFAFEWELPGIGDLMADGATTTLCGPGADCVGPPAQVRCDGGETVCLLQVTPYPSEERAILQPPAFPPAPVEITFRD
jgi:hypothetical protein